MRKKTSPIILEGAIAMVPEYANVLDKPDRQVALRGQSKSTLSNYGRRIALFVIHFQCLPHQVSEDEINEYLASLARDPKSPSRSSFKHMVYGLRYYFRLIGINEKAIACPHYSATPSSPSSLTVQSSRSFLLPPHS
jgi:hypothetical protein